MFVTNPENPGVQYPVCRNCDFAILPGKPHVECDRILAEEAKAWEDRRDQRMEELEDEYRSELCPCGHTHADHFLEDDFCRATGCKCPQFGEPVENYETHTITNVGGDPGGFEICE